MTMAAAYAGVWLLAAVIYHEIRVAGHRRDDQELVESAAVMTGVAVAVLWAAHLALTQGGPVFAPERTGAALLLRGSVTGVAATAVLLGLEAEMAADGRIEHEWLLFEPIKRWAK
jgi:hypothetical protein